MSGESLVSLWKCFLRGITNDSEGKFMGIFPDVQGAGVDSSGLNVPPVAETNVPGIAETNVPAVAE